MLGMVGADLEEFLKHILSVKNVPLAVTKCHYYGRTEWLCTDVLLGI